MTVIAPAAVVYPMAFQFPTLAAAQACATAVDAALGFPKAGTFVGAGIHAPMVTRTYFDPLPHPTKALWAYLADAVTQPILAKSGLSAGMAAQPIDASWAPPEAV